MDIFKVSILFLLIITLSSCAMKTSKESKDNESFSFGVIADCQYCNAEKVGIRYYNISDSKLKKCVHQLNTLDLEFTIHLGDFIDKDWESFDVVGPIYDKLKMPKYHVLGNHDFSVIDERKSEVVKKMGLSSEYYDFEVKGWRFVVLNGNDISFHAYPKNSYDYKMAEEYYVENNITSPKWNGAMGKAQMQWLESVLRAATENNEKVILYSHFPIFPENIHNLWNASEVLTVIEKYNVVKAYINGHNHEGNYGIKNGVHFITMKGMVDTEETSYAVINLSKDHLEIVGYGRESSKILELKQ
ncbi:metallophosphoesterase [Aureibaculum sp. 2210JD6-5]|uniref:metallophosphoesterase n=1 Tax=Aureibaculum sp. 2210JD6-5 TaxID=3103957 RepID=UPI002AAD8394|nr:metallophosphoesterase [Aureibaculum sp. 2210JD6-5]MDY7394037.1 metallophosphoesterase [Aureibaculum sp. 2210JD6-5]